MVSNYEDAVSLGADSNEVVTRHRTMDGLVVKIKSGETVVKPLTEDLVTGGGGGGGGGCFCSTQGDWQNQVFLPHTLVPKQKPLPPPPPPPSH